MIWMIFIKLLKNAIQIKKTKNIDPFWWLIEDMLSNKKLIPYNLIIC